MKLHLHEAVVRTPWIPTVASPAIAAIASSFETNMERAYGLMQLPAVLHSLGLFPVLREQVRHANESGDDRQRAEIWVLMVKRGSYQLDALCEEEGFFRRQLEQVLSSMIVGAWTAFETMSSDLWTAALNSSPQGLATLNGVETRIATHCGTLKSARREQLASSAKKDTKADDGKTVRLKEIAEITKGTFDLRNSMGEVLKGKFNFSTLEAIRRAYSAAFSKQSEGIDEPLSDKALDALSTVRNAIVHSGGKADMQYMNKSKHLGLVPSVGLGEQIPLDGKLIEQLVGGTDAASLRLLHGVDDWLTKASG